AQEHAVDDREHGGVRADADGEREYGDERERRVAPQSTQRIAHVAAEQIEVLARRGGEDAADGVPPEPRRAGRAGAPQHVVALIAEGRGHVLAVVSAEIGGEKTEQAAEDTLGAGRTGLMAHD